jgi:hypothetical protein
MLSKYTSPYKIRLRDDFYGRVFSYYYGIYESGEGSLLYEFLAEWKPESGFYYIPEGETGASLT